jgi:hypothetical protein
VGGSKSGSHRSVLSGRSQFGGIYLAVYSSEKSAGDYYWMDIRQLCALDRNAAIGRIPNSEMVKVLTEFLAFVD